MMSYKTGGSVTVVFYIIFLNLFVLPYSTTGTVVIFPSPRAVVCRVGDRLQVTCNTTESALIWRLTSIGMAHPIVERSTSSTTVAFPRLMINSSRITISRISERGAVPLISVLEISPVSDGLNGTLNITCVELGTSLAATTTVYIAGSIHGSYYSPKSPIVDIEENFGIERVTVSLSWTQGIHQGLLVSYHITVEPVTDATLTIIGRTRANLTVPYNTPHNVSVVADLCGQRNATMPITDLNYRGSFELLSRDVKIAVASSVTVFVISSILFFIVGFLCRHYCSCLKEKKVAKTGETHTPYYDDIVLRQPNEQQLELKENVAYAPVQ